MTMPNALAPTAVEMPPVSEAGEASSIKVRRGPISDIAVAADGSTIVTANSCDESVAVLNADARAVDAVVPVEGEPFAVAVFADRAFVAAAAPTHDVLSAIHTHTDNYLASLPLNMEVVGIAASHDGRRLFAAGTGRDGPELAIVDVESGAVYAVRVAEADSAIDAVAVASDDRYVLVAISDTVGGSIEVVDTARVCAITPLHTALPVRDMVLSNDGSVVYVLGFHPEYGGVIETIDTRTDNVLSTAWTGGNATQFALSADGSRMYVVCDDRVAVLCLATRDIIGTIGIGEHPSAVAISNDGARLYVADYAGRVTIPPKRLRPDAPRGPESVGSHATRAVL